MAERIRLQTQVVNISRGIAGGHNVSYVCRKSDTEEWDTIPQVIHAPYVAICTGLHVIPAIPEIEGISHVLKIRDSDNGIERKAFHSVDYKSRSQLAGRRVMVLGTGETG